MTRRFYVVRDCKVLCYVFLEPQGTGGNNTKQVQVRVLV